MLAQQTAENIATAQRDSAAACMPSHRLGGCGDAADVRSTPRHWRHMHVARLRVGQDVEHASYKRVHEKRPQEASTSIEDEANYITEW